MSEMPSVCRHCAADIPDTARKGAGLCKPCIQRLSRTGSLNVLAKPPAHETYPPCLNCGRDDFTGGEDRLVQGMCRRCYSKQRLHGDPNYVDAKSREYAVVAGPHGCMIWTKPPDAQGYVHTRGTHGQREKAHVVAYRQAHGEIPEGFVVDHRCHNEALHRGDCEPGRCFHRACINPDHLEAVTNSENIRRARTHKTECIRGHSLLDPANLKPNKKGTRICRACVRINTRVSRGYTEAEAIAREDAPSAVE